MENMMVCGSQMKGQEFDAKMPEVLAIGAEMDVSLYNQLAEMVGGTKMMVKRKGHKIIIKPVAPEQVSEPKTPTTARKRADWINEYYTAYLADEADGKATCLVDYEGRKVTVCVAMWDGIRIGTAQCHENDEFDEVVGIAVATAKIAGAEIPDFI